MQLSGVKSYDFRYQSIKSKSKKMLHGLIGTRAKSSLPMKLILTALRNLRAKGNMLMRIVGLASSLPIHYGFTAKASVLHDPPTLIPLQLSLHLALNMFKQHSSIRRSEKSKSDSSVSKLSGHSGARGLGLSKNA